jgi:hypothetical protein
MAEKKKQKRSPAEVEKENRERFLRIATPRVQRVIKGLNVLGNCAGSGYAYTPEQVVKMEKVLLDALTNTLSLFRKKREKQEGFAF